MTEFSNKLLHSMTNQKKERLVWGFWCTNKRTYYVFLTLGLASLFGSTKLPTKWNERWIIHLLSVCATSLLLLAWHFLEWRRKGTGEVPFTSLTYLSTTSIPTSIHSLPLEFSLVYHIGLNFIPVVHTAEKSALCKK